MSEQMFTENKESLVSVVAESLLRSKVVAALAWPHRVDRYVELVNPMWAASDVRARVIDVRRENPASEAAQVATITLQPTSTWRGHMAGQHVTVGSGSAWLQTPDQDLLDQFRSKRPRRAVHAHHPC
ncbi:MAG: hypothetical protein V9G13_13615 [Marmoricola sp.]